MVIRELHTRLGNKWSEIAKHLPGRTDNEVKNYWRTRIHKKPHQSKLQLQAQQHPGLDSVATSESASASASTSQASSTVGDEYMQASFPYPELTWVADQSDVGAITTRFFSSSDDFGDNVWNVEDRFWETLPFADPVYEAL